VSAVFVAGRGRCCTSCSRGVFSTGLLASEELSYPIDDAHGESLRRGWRLRASVGDVEDRVPVTSQPWVGALTDALANFSVKRLPFRRLDCDVT
jgi:hypothetical protein